MLGFLTELSREFHIECAMFFCQLIKVTQKTGLLRLVVENPSDLQASVPGIESFKDLLGESEKDTPVVSIV